MWLSDCKVVLPDQVLERGSIKISDGKIAEIVEGPVANADIRATHLTAIPGLVDMHGDMVEREVHPRPRAEMPIDIATYELDKRLVGAGITTAFAAISFAWLSKESLRTDEGARNLIEGMVELKPKLLCDHYIHARFEITNPNAGNLLIDLLNQQKIHLVSIMDHTPGQGQYRDLEKYMAFIKKWRTQMQGEEVTEEEIRSHVEERQAMPKAWDIVSEVSRIAGEYGTIVASHDDDTPEKIEMVSGFGVTISEFPVTAEAAQAAKDKGMFVAMGSPNAFRGVSTSGNLSAFEAVSNGLVDILATDYHPASMLQAATKIAREGVMPLHESIKLVSSNAAKSVQLEDRGELVVGKKADVVLFDNRERPRVHATLRDGVPVFWDRTMAELTDQSQAQVEMMGQ